MKELTLSPVVVWFPSVSCLLSVVRFSLQQACFVVGVGAGVRVEKGVRVRERANVVSSGCLLPLSPEISELFGSNISTQTALVFMYRVVLACCVLCVVCCPLSVAAGMFVGGVRWCRGGGSKGNARVRVRVKIYARATLSLPTASHCSSSVVYVVRC